MLASAITELSMSSFSDRVVEWVKACVHFDNIAFIAFFQDRQPSILASYSNHPSVHLELDTSYVEGAYLLDPFHELHVKRVPRGAYRLSDIAPDHFQRNQYYITYYCNTTLVDEITVVSYPSEGVSIQISFGRDSNSNLKYTTKELVEAQRLAPILAALAEKHWSELNTTGTYKVSDTISRLVKSANDQLGIQLTPRQAEVAVYILRGHSSKSIAMELEISHQTVKVFRKQLYKRLNISSQAELFNLLISLLKR